MKVIKFMNWISVFALDSMVKTFHSDNLLFFVNKSSDASSDSDIRVSFDGGISVRDLLGYIAQHNLEAHTMYASDHREIYVDEIGVIGNEFFIR